MFNKEKTELICYPAKKAETSYTVPNSVITICNSAFGSSKNLTEISIPNSVKNIGNSAFSYCTALTEFTIPDSVTEIGVNVFSDCKSLESIVIGEGVKSINDGAFKYCDALTEITIPDHITDIGDYAFYYCKNLASVTIGSGVETIGYSVFSNCNKLKDIYYHGTQSDFEKISVGDNNAPLASATKHYTTIEISTLAELEAFRDDVNNGNTYEGKTVKLTADIDMSDKYGEGKESWIPINTFAGTFDGDNHTISGFYAYPDEEYSQASFFGTVNGTIENLNVKGIVISNNLFDCATAGIVVWLNENAQMLNCSFEGVVKGFNASGLVSTNFGVISGCKFNGKVEGTHLVGGIASNNDETIMNCINEGEIIGSSPVGGIAGAGTGAIKNCINKGSVKGKPMIITNTDYESGEEITESIPSTDVGGIIGDIERGVIENCYNTGAVSGNTNVGGIIGVSPFYNGELDNIVLSQVKNCYNIGNITSTMEKNDGEHNIGAIIGSREFDYSEDGENFTKVLTSEAVNCYYLVGTADKGCGGNADDTTTALTTEQFANKTNFTNWDFETVWKMDASLGRPVLRSNREEPPIQTHTHTLVHHEAAAATCTENGIGEYWKCEGTDACNKMFSDADGTTEIAEIPTTAATGHDYGDWSITTEPTFNEIGKAEHICCNDNTHKEIVDLPVLSDTSVWEVGLRVEPTEIFDGFIQYISQYGAVSRIIHALSDKHFLIEYFDGTAMISSRDAGTYSVIFAAYDENGVLTSVEFESVTFETAGMQEVTPENFNANGAKTVKVMLWESIESMKPCCDSDTVIRAAS